MNSDDLREIDGIKGESRDFKPKKLFFVTALALGVLLFAETRQASAASPYDQAAYYYLTVGLEYATVAYEANPNDPDAYKAYFYAWWAQAYSYWGLNWDNKECWDYAWANACQATNWAFQSYRKGNISSYYAIYYLDYGWIYSQDAWWYFE